MDRSTKERHVEQMRDIFQTSELVVLTHQNGLSVAQVDDLRAKIRDAGARFKVTKNRLAKIALEGTKFSALADQFTGPTAIATSEDPIAAAKVVVDYAKDNDKLVVIGGCLDEKILSGDDVNALAKLPSLDELRAKIIGLLQAPATKVATVMQAPAGQLARVFGAKAAQTDEAA